MSTDQYFSHKAFQAVTEWAINIAAILTWSTSASAKKSTAMLKYWRDDEYLFLSTSEQQDSILTTHTLRAVAIKVKAMTGQQDVSATVYILFDSLSILQSIGSLEKHQIIQWKHMVGKSL